MREEMRKKPKGQRYRNLSPRRGAIYYERLWNGRRYCFSTKTADLDQAAAVRDLYEEQKGIGKTLFMASEIPKFQEFAKRYLEEDTGHLASTTRKERARELGADGPLVPYFGSIKLDEISASDIRQWWTLNVQVAKRSTKTGRNYLDSLSGVFAYARDLGIIDSNPVNAFREILARKTRTQRGRIESDPSRNIRPIKDPEDIDRLVGAASDESAEAYVLVLLCLDAGLRVGEALGLRWGHVVWGIDEDDERRALLIEESRPRGGDAGPTKSGRGRRVALARRLREALKRLYRAAWGPDAEAHVLPDRAPSVFRRVEWRRILKRAEIGEPRLKDLRDTYASQLLTAGIQLGYVSAQLGHADVGITARHYAKWVGGDVYREPMRLELGEVPADLLARLSESQRSPKTYPVSDEDDLVSRRETWWSQRESNPCLQGENLVS